MDQGREDVPTAPRTSATATVWVFTVPDLRDGASGVDLTPLDPGSRAVGADPLPSVSGSMLVTMNRRNAVPFS
ncbi:hypothetical protein [Streptomyces sp. NBC_01716]|uniref:hypothetical protein n=1 Tax=Streptomyces sp. NBC_01716 TaxID=2975917 RepID=UPI002E2F392B|nr:hypothetical protein [Streptomyces sp. NBC_01716]